VIAWALTYVLHSTLLVIAAAALVRTPWGRAERARDTIWKCALVGALLTATLQQVLGGPASLAVPVSVEESRPALASADSAPAADPVAIRVFRVLRGPWLALAWAVTSGLAALRLGRGWLLVRRAAGRRRVLTGGPLRRELDAILREAGVTRRVTLSCSRGLVVPRAIGAGEICVPIRVLRDLSAPEQRALLAHETAHLLRHDGAWLLAAAVLQIVAWWQPLTRLAAARLRHSMELCCDDWAAARLPDRMALAECLVKVGEWGVFAPRGVALAAFAGSALRERVERLVDADRLEGDTAWRSWPAAVLLLAVLALAPRVTLAVVMAASPPVAATATDVVASEIIAPAEVGEHRRDERPAPPVRPRVALAPSPPQLAPPAPSEIPEEPAPATPASHRSQIITMPEPLIHASPSSISTALARAATSAARSVPPRTAPQPIIAKDDLLRRVDAWVGFVRRNPSFDPFYPRY
jgi:beta-lactamase regulating signal transducer with metallopeptidase domain